MLDKPLEHSLDLAFRIAYEKSNEFMTLEHLLLALLENDEIKKILLACSVDIVSLHIELSEFLDTNPSLSEIKNERLEVQPTIAFERVLNVLFSMSNHQVKQKLARQMCWWLFLVNKNHKRFIF